MSVTFEVLGSPGRDNALLTTVNTGQSQHRLLFDCGEGCLDRVPRADIQAIEVLFFSHFHIDHVAGFDSFFRSNWFREDEPVRIFGPEGTIEIIHHRMRGVTWNLVEGVPGEIYVTEKVDHALRTSRFLAREGFSVQHPFDQCPFDGVAYRRRAFSVRAKEMYHGTASMVYMVQEDDRRNVNTKVLAEDNLRPGPWLKQLKDPSVPPDTEIELGGKTRELGELRERLLVRQPSESIAVTVHGQKTGIGGF